MPGGNTVTHSDAVRRAVLTISRCGGRGWRQEVGLFRNLRGEGLHKIGIEGMADVGGITKDGRCLQIEVKTGKATRTSAQKAWGKMIMSLGGVYVIARYNDEVDGDLAITQALER